LKNSLAEQFDAAVKVFKDGKYKEAIVLFNEVLKKKKFKEAWINIGLCFREIGKLEIAETCFLSALNAPYANGEVDNSDSASLTNLGSIAYNFEKDSEAREYYRKALEKDPNNHEAGWNYGCTGIRMFCDGKESNLLENWFYYDKRFRLYDLSVLHDVELWDFRSIHPESGIVVLRDQGMGDTLMFARYLPWLEQYFARVYVQTDSSMQSLFNNYDINSDVQYAVPMCSLGKLLDYIPAGDWLSSKRKGDGNGIGCVWSGSNTHTNDHNRSCPPSYFDRLEGSKFTIGPNSAREGYTHLDGTTWQDTIDNLNKLSLVISVDTSIVHMCGCLGIECWLLLPLTFSDYRWGTGISGEHCVWYNSVCVIRNLGNWDDVFDRVQEKLNGRL